MKIGVMVESFRTGLDGGLQAAAELGANGVQMYTTKGETHPDNLKGDARKELLKRVKGMGLEFSAICADFGHGFGDAAARSVSGANGVGTGPERGCAAARDLRRRRGRTPTLGLPGRTARQPVSCAGGR